MLVWYAPDVISALLCLWRLALFFKLFFPEELWKNVSISGGKYYSKWEVEIVLKLKDFVSKLSYWLNICLKVLDPYLEVVKDEKSCILKVKSLRLFYSGLASKESPREPTLWGWPQGYSKHNDQNRFVKTDRLFLLMYIKK